MSALVKNRFALAALIVISLLAIVFTLVKLLHTPPAPTAQLVMEEKVLVQNNQSVSVFKLPKSEKGLLFFISGNPQHTQDYAQQFAQLSYTVAVLDSQSFISNANGEGNCIKLASYLGSLRKQLQTQYGLDQEHLPILVGTDTGAGLVYTILAQAEPGNFHAGISINFKAELPQSTKPPCSVNNFSFSGSAPVPAKHLPAAWYIFQEKALALSAKTNSFTDQVSNARLTIADDPSQPPLTEAIQVLQWLDPRLTDQISSDRGDSDLPLIEVVREKVDSQTDATAPADLMPDTMAVLLTGDGGWAEIDKRLARLLADKGIPTVALDSLSYFWKARTPVDTAKDIESVITQYRNKWQKQRVILIGYSFGADVLPFIANKLTEDTQKHIALVALLGMGKTAAFEFRLSSWMNADKNKNRLPLSPEVKAMSWAKSVCIYGLDDPDTQCATTGELGVKPISMSGDHHFNENYEELVQHIIDNAKP